MVNARFECFGRENSMRKLATGALKRPSKRKNRKKVFYAE